MKKLMIRIGLLLLVFAAVFAGVYFYQNRKPVGEMVQMDEAALPMLYILCGEERINGMHGYVGEMDAAAMRDTLTPVDESRRISVQVDTYGRHLTGISYEVRSLDRERLIEKTELVQWEDKDRTVNADFRLENLIEEGEEYLLTICLTVDGNTDVRYYTRILMGVEAVEDKLAYALDFSRKTLQKEEAESLIMYLESNARGDNTNFGRVDIYSSFDQITWGNLKPVRVMEPVPAITDVNGNITSIRLEYQVQIKNMYGTVEICNVREFFRTNYTPDRTYLLTYERTMDQKFRAVSENVSASRINLGIASTVETPFITDEDGTQIVFSRERELWKYSSRDNAIECIFSFRDSGDDGVRAEWNQHEVRPVQIDGQGNVYFVVYGYMNRGIHEGSVGVTLYRYQEENERVEEIFFLPYTKSFAYLKQSMGEMFYITPGNHFCFLLGGSLYSVDLASLEYVRLIDGLSEGSYVINQEGNMIAWQPEQDIRKSQEIKRLQLDTNKEDTITSEQGSIRVIGFIEDDLVYGSVYKEDLKRTIAGDMRAYMSRLYIVDRDNRQAGSYYKEGYYFTEAKIESNMITLTRFRKLEDGTFAEAEEDVITNNTVSGESGISVTMLATELKKKEAGINIRANAEGKDLKVSYARIVVYPGERQLLIGGDETDFAYYVYAKGGLMEAAENISEAIRIADSQAGAVLRADGSYAWRRGNRNSSITLSVTMPESEEIPLAKALDALLRYAGTSVNSAEKLAQGKLAADIINEGLKQQAVDLTGLSLRQVLYFVDTGRPVLARLSEEEYVLVVGFDAYNALLLDTTGRKAYKVGLEDGTELFEKAGNEFLTYGE